MAGERTARNALLEQANNSTVLPEATGAATVAAVAVTWESQDKVENDRRDLDWSAVLKRTFESYIRGERPNMYGEWIYW